MNAPLLSIATSSELRGGPDPAGSRGTRLQGRWIVVARAAWAVVAILALGLFIVGIPASYGELSRRFHVQAVGLDARPNRAGEYVLSPWSNMPAARAGVLEGDVLVAVDGVPARGEAGLAAVQALSRGVIGGQVQLSLRTGDRPVRNTALTRGGDELRVLAPLGLSVEAMAAFALAVDLALALVCVVVAGVIVWYRSADWLALLVSATTLMFVGIAPPFIALYRTRLEWQPRLDLWVTIAFVVFSTFTYVFPDGRFVPRWTRALAGILAVWMITALFYPPLYPWRMPLGLGVLVLLGWLGTGIAAQVYRYFRVSDSVQRQQTKWVVFGAALAIPGVLVTYAAPGLIWPQPSGAAILGEALVIRPVGELLMVMLPVSIGIALLRYHLWDVDVLIRRTLVYGALTASVIAIYALVVGSLGALFQAQGGWLAGLLGTGLAAVLFQPLRERLQRAVNRLMFGQRDDPDAVLSDLGRRLEANLAPEAVPQTIVETVVQVLKLPYAAIELLRDGAFEVVASAGMPANDPLRLPLVYRGETVGGLVWSPRSGEESFGPADRRVLEGIARQAGVAVRAVSLMSDLQRSRERLVTAREEERRRLRRDLHDGLGPTLASLFQRLDTAGVLVKRDPEAAVALIGNLKEQVKATVADLRQLVYALRPPALDDFGLVVALREHAAQLSEANGIPVAFAAQEAVPALPAAVEVAAYRICVEALANVVRHSQAKSCRLSLTVSDAMYLEIVDDGRGLPPGYHAGVGISSMRERAAEVGGQCRVEPGPAGGTRVRARLPVPE